MKTVLVTGGTGLIGKHLCHFLKQSGYHVAILSQIKHNKSEFPVFYWNWKKQEIDETALQNSDYIIHLAGANIAGQRWSDSRKKLILDSRVQSTLFLQKKIKELNLSPSAFISASAVGYYGMITDSHIYKESDSPADDFLGDVCAKWENAATQVYDPRIRTVQLRTGIVLTSKGGALQKMTQPIQAGIGSPLGSGKQFIPWIHIDDLCQMYLDAIQNTHLHGAYNASAPEHHTNRSFTKTIAQKLNRPIWLPPVPAFVLKMIFGDMAKLLLYGSRASSEKIKSTGFSFKYPELKAALDDLLS
ncbi:TIGR01777 family oxidoreductase [bacterium SCSIO 12643]|nr:TIGR01777 family oxidoreductase [bacterium SCSIO 12643]